jgi:hypothetical protein
VHCHLHALGILIQFRCLCIDTHTHTHTLSLCLPACLSVCLSVCLSRCECVIPANPTNSNSRYKISGGISNNTGESSSTYRLNTVSITCRCFRAYVKCERGLQPAATISVSNSMDSTASLTDSTRLHSTPKPCNQSRTKVIEPKVGHIVRWMEHSSEHKHIAISNRSRCIGTCCGSLLNRSTEIQPSLADYHVPSSVSKCQHTHKRGSHLQLIDI